MHTTSVSLATGILSCFLGCTISNTVAAQFISPIGFDSTEGPNNNTYPFNNTSFHYQQVHGDVRGTVQLIKGLSFRKNDDTGTKPGKTVTIEL